ncbi:hypothetical protein WJX82_002181 [Trebouxia sp. C0006]
MVRRGDAISDGQNTTSSPEPEPELVVPNAIGRNGIVVQPIPEEPLAASEPESTVVYTLPDGTPLSVTTSKVLIPPTPRTVALPGTDTIRGSVRVPIDNLGPVAGDQGVFNSDGNPQAEYYRAGTFFQPLTEAQVYYDSDKIRSITGVAGGLDFDSTNEQQTVYCSYTGADNSQASSPSAPQVVIPPNTPLKSAILRDSDYGKPRSASSLDLEWQSGLSLVVPAHTSGDPEGQHIVGVHPDLQVVAGFYYKVNQDCFLQALGLLTATQPAYIYLSNFVLVDYTNPTPKLTLQSSTNYIGPATITYPDTGPTYTVGYMSYSWGLVPLAGSSITVKVDASAYPASPTGMRALNQDKLTTELLSTIRTTYAQPSLVSQYGFDPVPAVETVLAGTTNAQQSAIPSTPQTASILNDGQQASVDVYTVNYGFVVAYTATVQPQDINGLPVGPAVDNFRGHLSYGISTGVIHYSNYTALAF